MPGPDCLFHQMTSGLFARDLRALDWSSSSFPLSASMDWTSGCNLRCRHCFLRYPGAAQEAAPTRQVERMLDILRDLGVLFLVITGGEPLARPDFKPLYSRAKQCGFVLTLFTNGSLLDDDLLDFLADAPPRRVEITIYGHTEGVYESVTGVPGAFQRFRHGVEGLLRRGLLVRLKAMIMRANVHELDAMRDWAMGLGCDFRYDAIIHPRWNGDADPLCERLTPAAIVDLRRRDRACGRISGAGAAAPPALEARRRLFECGAGVMTMHVDGGQRAHPCMSWREDPFDLAAYPTVRAWREHVEVIRNRPAPGGLCDTCGARANCSCCPALALLETGRTSGAPSFFCRLMEEETRRRPEEATPCAAAP